MLVAGLVVGAGSVDLPDVSGSPDDLVGDGRNPTGEACGMCREARDADTSVPDSSLCHDVHDRGLLQLGSLRRRPAGSTLCFWSRGK